MPVRKPLARERGVRCLGWGLTESKLLLQADADEDEADHVGEQVDEAGVQPGAGLQPPRLVPVHHLVPVEGSVLLQPAARRRRRRLGRLVSDEMHETQRGETNEWIVLDGTGRMDSRGER